MTDCLKINGFDETGAFFIEFSKSFKSDWKNGKLSFETLLNSLREIYLRLFKMKILTRVFFLMFLFYLEEVI